MSTYTPIASQTLGSAASSVTFSSIPQGYTDLVCILTGTASSNNSNTYLQFNGDTSSLYSATYLGGDGSTVSSGRQSNQTKMLLDAPAYWNIAQGPNKIINIQNYSNSTTFKTVLTRANSNLGTDALTGLYRSTNPITTVTFLIDSNYATGATFSIYGIQVGQAAQKAQGGNIVTTDGTYMYHTFTSSGSFIPNESLTADYLVVGGGGGGGYAGYGCGGGGGGGGLRSTVTASGGTPGTVESALSLTAKSYTVSIGAGGTRGGNYPQTPSTAGGNSVFSTITSIGGGNGASQGDSVGGGTGGSGGGEAAFGTAGIGAGTPYQGFAGGARANVGGYSAAGGGGGASAAGGAGSGGGGQGGIGGAGRAVSILGSSITYAGGGGGGKESGTAGAGGAGGGGAGNSSQSSNATNGTVSLGGGGGGQGYSGGGTNNTFGGNGGSGVVIIRYLL